MAPKVGPEVAEQQAFLLRARERLNDLATLEAQLGLTGELTRRGRRIADALQAGISLPVERWAWQELVEEDRCSRLDRATTEHVASLSAELDLAQFWSEHGDRFNWGEVDVLYQPQGPVWQFPVAWLPAGGQPLFQRVRSIGAVPSLGMWQLWSAQCGDFRPRSREILSAMWLKPDDWSKMRGLANLHAGLLRLAECLQRTIFSLGDEPAVLASRNRLQAAFCRGGLGPEIAVIGGHGSDSDTGGIQLADGVWLGEGTDLSQLDWLLFAACAAGRLKQYGGSDIEGFCARLLAHGGRCLLAARWDIADDEAATLVVEVLARYLIGHATGRTLAPFERARALNAARKALLNGSLRAAGLTGHVAAAFEVYGFG